MQHFITSLDTMFAVWNSSDPAEQQRLADQALDEHVHFVDPNHDIVGRDAFLAMVGHVQQLIPGAVYARAAGIDVQHDYCRYHWSIHRDGRQLMTGFDVTKLNDVGRIVQVIGFFGELAR